MELIKGFPVNSTNIESELTTPTGAAILTTLADFEKPLTFKPVTIGYGAGTKDIPGLPNLLRVIIAETESGYDSDTINVLETNLDRVTPENLGGLTNELMERGALDVLITPVTMKKSRPGHLLTVLCEPVDTQKISGIIFSRGLTLGMRVSSVSRLKLPRKETTVKTSGGDVAVKLADFDGREIVIPEYDDINVAMKKSNKSYEDIYFEIMNKLEKES
jgi:uncharacterized protein (DUF111 family)